MSTFDAHGPGAPVESTVWKEEISLIDSIPRPLAILGLGLIIVLIWHFATATGVVSNIILPSPLETWREIVFVGTNLVTGGYMLAALWVTMQEVLIGFVLATLIGVGLGVLVGETRFGERAVMPYLIAIDTMPKIAFAPLFVAWLGFDISSKVALATFVSVFPILVGTAAGLNSADRSALNLFRTMGASRWQTLVHMKMPAGLPHVFTGLKIASLGVMAGAITGEFLGGGKGFGEMIRVAASQLHTPRVFALILYLSLLGLAMFGTVSLIQRKLVFWHKDGRDAGE
ncbi:ABC transporter permease [Rhizobium sp. Root73]|uniref:ABC transporter permease n=1 Tax=unclassified Rhizobium TaxID=2613769 RepID=UPI00072960C0|nr:MULTISPECIES: ABC transporter permease [unclassified Rhizobium]KQY16761.1 ABC transporter permease [Rhizobium sp. Root1334]KRC11323.1 ABC transporter permease [Rhizobium sp. Root73]